MKVNWINKLPLDKTKSRTSAKKKKKKKKIKNSLEMGFLIKIVVQVQFMNGDVILFECFLEFHEIRRVGNFWKIEFIIIS